MSATVTAERRRFISEQLEASRVLTFEEIRARFPGAERASLHLDVAAMRKAGIPVTIVGTKKQRRLMLETSRKVTSKKAFREDWMTSEKQDIAAVTAAVIFGNTKPVTCGRISDGMRDSKNMESYDITRDHIEKTLFTFSKADPSVAKRMRLEDLVAKLRGYWVSNDKALSLDSGTTTDHVAEKIRHFNVVEDLEGLNNVTLFTNSRSVFTKTGVPECNIKTIIIGGRQRHQTESISGELAMRCLRAWDLSFGMTIVGATGIDISTLVLGSYNDEEAAMKQALLARAKIKVVIADVTKFDRHSFKITSRFAALHHDSIDLMIIDSCPDMDKICPGYQAGNYETNLVKFMNFMPVPVLIADEVKKIARISKTQQG